MTAPTYRISIAPDQALEGPDGGAGTREAASAPAWSRRVRPAGVDVLVVLVNYNGGPWLAQALAALERQSITGFRVAVVDNGSTDGSIDLVRTRHAQVRVLHAGRNLGYAAANNLAVRLVPEARWIALLNPDAIPEPDWLDELLRTAFADPRCASVASRTVNAADVRLLDGAGDAYHVSGLAWRRGHRRTAAGRYLDPEDVFSACGAAALYRRDAWDAAGGLDESFFCYMEDVDLGFRLRLAGYTCRYAPSAVARHVCSAITGRQSDFAVFHGQRNLVWVFVKNMPGPLLWLLLPLHFALNVAALFILARRSQGRVALRAKIEALRGLPDAWRARRRVQAARTARASQIWRALSKALRPLR